MGVDALMENFIKLVTRHYFDFRGRTRRREFWWYVLVMFVTVIVLVLLANLASPFGVLGLIFVLYVFLPTLGVSVRRLHDIGHSGWWILLPVLPTVLMVLFIFINLIISAILFLVMIACSILFIYWCAQPGTSGQNKYGLDPKDP